MPDAAKTSQGPELALEERRERRRLRREKQRENNVHRAAKMHAARLEVEATSLKAAAEPKAPLYVGCSGWRYWVRHPYVFTGNRDVDERLSGFPVALFHPQGRRPEETPVVLGLQGMAQPYVFNSFLVPALLDMLLLQIGG